MRPYADRPPKLLNPAADAHTDDRTLTTEPDRRRRYRRGATSNVVPLWDAIVDCAVCGTGVPVRNASDTRPRSSIVCCVDHEWRREHLELRQALVDEHADAIAEHVRDLRTAVIDRDAFVGRVGWHASRLEQEQLAAFIDRHHPILEAIR